MTEWEDAPEPGSVWRSKKTNTKYVVEGHCILFYNSTKAVLFKLNDNIHPWAIELREFLGRFEPVE